MLIKINKDELDVICTMFYLVESEIGIMGNTGLAKTQELVKNRFDGLQKIAEQE